MDSFRLYPIIALNREDMRFRTHIIVDIDWGGRDNPGATHFQVP